MSKIIKSLSFVALLFLLFACGGNNKQLIVGKWKVDEKALEALINKQMEKLKKENPQAANMAEMTVKIAVNAVKGVRIEFKADGTSEAKVMGMTIQGTWKISDDGKQLISEVMGKQSTQEIIELSAGKLVLGVPDEQKNPNSPITAIVYIPE